MAVNVARSQMIISKKTKLYYNIKKAISDSIRNNRKLVISKCFYLNLVVTT